MENLLAMGSYEAWSTAVRAGLAWLGEADPALTQRELASASDNDAGLLTELLEGWVEIDPSREGLTTR